MTATSPVTEYGGFELALGSVFAVRWFRPDRYGRLHAINHSFIWKPGENVAECLKGEHGWYSRVNFAFTTSFTFTVTDEGDEPEQTAEAPTEVEHLVPVDSCGCGFYAFAEDCDNSEYRTEAAVRGVIECYGRTILGTRGLRCEKARIVGLLTDREDIRRAYPDVEFFRPVRTRLHRRKGATKMLAAFDVVQPYVPSPDDPDFWERP